MIHEHDAQEVIDALHERAEEFCRWLLPNGKRAGAYWEVGNITGDPGRSLRIHVEGDKVGVWADHAAGSDATGPTLLHLLMQKRGTTNFGKTVVEAKGWLGWKITADEDRVFHEQGRNGGKFETAAKDYAKLSPDGPVYRYLTEVRKISPSILAQYRVLEHKTKAEMCFAQLGATGKTVTFTKYVAVQRKPDGSKSEYINPVGAKPGLWGKYAVDEDAEELVICEGEIDALSAAEAGFAAVAMPMGAGNDKWIEQNWRWLLRFRSIILCYDPDDAGQKGLDKAYPILVSRLGRYRCRIARLPAGVKDPNEAIQKGLLAELSAALGNAESIDPPALRNLREYRDEVRELFFPTQGSLCGHPVPWTDRLRLRPAEITLWTGISGHGKTTALLQCLAHLAAEHDERAIIACMESPVRKSAAILCRQFCGYEIKRPEAFERIYDRVQSNLWVYDFVGNAPWKDLLETFRYAWRRYGVTQFAIDSVMTCDLDTDDYNEQSKFIGALAEFAAETNGHVHVVAHARKGKDEKEPPGKMDVAGHANLTNRTFNGVTVFRNKAKTEAVKLAAELSDPRAMASAQEQHDAELVCWKQRETGDEFHIPLWFHRGGLQFWPEKNTPSRNYVSAKS